MSTKATSPAVLTAPAELAAGDQLGDLNAAVTGEEHELGVVEAVVVCSNVKVVGTVFVPKMSHGTVDV